MSLFQRIYLVAQFIQVKLYDLVLSNNYYSFEGCSCSWWCFWRRYVHPHLICRVTDHSEGGSGKNQGSTPLPQAFCCSCVAWYNLHQLQNLMKDLKLLIYCCCKIIFVPKYPWMFDLSVLRTKFYYFWTLSSENSNNGMLPEESLPMMSFSFFVYWFILF